MERRPRDTQPRRIVSPAPRPDVRQEGRRYPVQLRSTFVRLERRPSAA
jgi:hypothetical protein